LVIDLRPDSERSEISGHVPGSCAILPDDVESALQGIAPDYTVVLVDDDEQRAAITGRVLIDSGRTSVGVLSGGIQAWRKLGYGVSRVAAKVDEILELHRKQSNVDVAERHRLSEQEVHDHLDDHRTVRYVKLASALAHGYTSCVDGRDERGVMGTPGGDAGEFILALAAWESLNTMTFSEDKVRALLISHFDTFGGLYIHTDETAFNNYTALLADDPRVTDVIGKHNDLFEWVSALRTPPESIRPILLEHLTTNPACIGCGHIRLMLQNSEEYSVRRDLVISVLRSIYELWWAGTPEINLTTLPGGHQEGAVVNVTTEEQMWDMMPVPLVSPVCSGTQMFVNHPQFSERLRRSTADALAHLMDPAHAASTADALHSRMMELGQQQLLATVGHLAKGLPIYEATLTRSGSWTVKTLSP
jgi:rhodanese-related sulfurtransferase